MPRLIKIAILCGAIPLLLGIAIYVSWRLTRVDSLETAGLVNIAAGLVAFLVGIVCLSIRSARTFSDHVFTRRRLLIFRAFAWILLLTNFPVAVLITRSVIIVKTSYTVTVVNERAVPIKSFIVTGPNFRDELAPVPAKGKVTRHFRFSGDGSLDFETQVDQVKTNGLIEGYVTPNLGGMNAVWFKADGGIEVGKVTRGGVADGVPLQRIQ